ncbi:phosphoribosylglycinamide formyltransferase [Thiocapsa imhoffii]|uniref:Phosphoribosylglycinamide formyltransferase n=1 Tax=Thiocapsa imhoffii TaxID=382777 RepID=A0A9X1B8B4_9GAMM|nr:phosphoribosylglycinamide formyltransferase [Thiocapsa imhoffii]MBK1644582.1 phosphoribosylglycinamide formyltransferase [Thiocapsa imhoffii]
MTDARRARILVLISGGGSNLQALIDAATAGAPFVISAVVSNRSDAFGLERARRAGIPSAVLDHRDYGERADYDAALATLIESFTPDLVTLAGFMRILTPHFVAGYSGRMLNIHPSLLPKFRGLQTHRRVLEARESEHGASVHFVTAELDGGPVVVQARVAVRPEDDAETLAARVLAREHVIYPLAVRWFAEGRLRLNADGVPWLDGAPLHAPVLIDSPYPSTSP